MTQSELVARLLEENKQDLEAGSAIMKEAEELMMDPETYETGAQMMKGAEQVWAAKGRELLRRGLQLHSTALVKAGNAHIKSAHNMAAMAFSKAQQAGR